jgi:DNA polymerase III subunit chi
LSAGVEISFYHLVSQPLEKALPKLVEKTRERGWRAVIEVATPERKRALDDLLWTYSEGSFLAHGVDDEPDAAEQPVLITTSAANTNSAEVRFLVDGIRLDPMLAGYQRVVLMFDDGDEAAKSAAREDWKTARTMGDAAYFIQNEDGRWEKKA